MKTPLTKEQALTEGFKYCVKDDEWEVLLHVADFNFEDYDEPFEIHLCDKEPTYHRIDEEEISNLIIEHLDAQEEFYSEDGFPDALNGCDDLLTELSEKINLNLRKHKFYMPTDIQLLKS